MNFQSAGRVQKKDKDSQNGKATTEKGMAPAIGTFCYNR